MHLSRLRKCLFDSADSMRPGDGERWEGRTAMSLEGRDLKDGALGAGWPGLPRLSSLPPAPNQTRSSGLGSGGWLGSRRCRQRCYRGVGEIFRQGLIHQGFVDAEVEHQQGVDRLILGLHPGFQFNRGGEEGFGID